MYFILSKLLLFIITPIYWVLVLLLIAAFTKRKKLRRWTSIGGLVIFLIFSNTWLLNSLVNAWEYAPVKLPDNARYSCVIVLGGFVSSTSDTTGHFNGTADRFFQGVDLQRTGKASHILITGGNGYLDPNAFSEGEWCRGELKKIGIPDSAVLIEGRSRNTIENAKLSAPILQKSGLKPPYILVTSAVHMRRAAMIFAKNNIDVIPYPADVLSHEVTWPKFADFIPDPNVIMGWGSFIKEVVGYCINRFIN